MKTLNDKQAKILRYAIEEGNGFTSSGRYGWPSHIIRSMEKKGLVKLHKQNTHDAEWKLTELGQRMGESIANKRP